MYMRNENVKFETERLFIRNFLPEDAASCMEGWGKDVNLGRYILSYPMKDLEQMKNFAEFLSKQQNAWLLIEKESRNAVGYVTMDIPYEILKIGEIGYVIGERYQGNAYAAEALRFLLHMYFTEQDLYLVEARYNAGNIASGKVLNRLGFKKEATLRGRRMDGITMKRNDMVVCSLTKEEFMQKNTTPEG